jgi:hypothetical protein
VRLAWRGGGAGDAHRGVEGPHEHGAARLGARAHAVSSCPKGAGPRGHVHDDIADVFVVLLKNAGFVDVEYEDV